MTNEFDTFIRKLAKLPGLGPRSAQRLMFHLLSNKESELLPLIASLEYLESNVFTCKLCNHLALADADNEHCYICRNPSRDQRMLCVVEQVADLWAMERAGGYHGRYYVLGGSLSAIDGIGPDELRLHGLTRLIDSLASIEEIILATSMTSNGQTTAHYIAHMLKDHKVTISRIALGVPMGGELDYLDATTLNAAFSDRRST